MIYVSRCFCNNIKIPVVSEMDWDREHMLLRKRSILMCKEGSSAALIHTWFPTIVPPKVLKYDHRSENLVGGDLFMFKLFQVYKLDNPAPQITIWHGKWQPHQQPGVDSKQKYWQRFHWKEYALWELQIRWFKTPLVFWKQKPFQCSFWHGDMSGVRKCQEVSGGNLVKNLFFMLPWSALIILRKVPDLPWWHVGAMILHHLFCHQEAFDVDCSPPAM